VGYACDFFAPGLGLIEDVDPVNLVIKGPVARSGTSLDLSLMRSGRKARVLGGYGWYPSLRIPSVVRLVFIFGSNTKIEEVMLSMGLEPDCKCCHSVETSNYFLHFLKFNVVEFNPLNGGDAVFMFKEF
jgi:hypothetical protein